MENQEINLAVAAIAGWTDVEEWRLAPKGKKAVKVYQGTNSAHPELGKFVPNYVESIDAIWKVFEFLDIKDYHIAECSANMDLPYEASQSTFQEPVQCFVKTTTLVQYGETPAIALCKLLLAIKPVQKAEVLEAVF